MSGFISEIKRLLYSFWVQLTALLSAAVSMLTGSRNISDRPHNSGESSGSSGKADEPQQQMKLKIRKVTKKEIVKVIKELPDVEESSLKTVYDLICQDVPLFEGLSPQQLGQILREQMSQFQALSDDDTAEKFVKILKLLSDAKL